jgi:hypothetical protein
MPDPAIQQEMEPSPDLLRDFLSGRDVPCPNCEYNLRDLQGPLCPECGEKIMLQVGLAEPRQGLLIAGLVGLSAGAGMSGLLLIYIVIQLNRRTVYYRDIRQFIAFNVGGLFVEGLALTIWMLNWRRLRRAPFSARFYLMLACWILTLLNIFLFSFAIK